MVSNATYRLRSAAAQSCGLFDQAKRMTLFGVRCIDWLGGILGYLAQADLSKFDQTRVRVPRSRCNGSYWPKEVLELSYDRG